VWLSDILAKYSEGEHTRRISHWNLRRSPGLPLLSLVNQERHRSLSSPDGNKDGQGQATHELLEEPHRGMTYCPPSMSPGKTLSKIFPTGAASIQPRTSSWNMSSCRLASSSRSTYRRVVLADKHLEFTQGDVLHDTLCDMGQNF
jgi:hypothetical protein